MTSDSVEQIVPDEQQSEEANYPPASFLIVMGLIAGACSVIAAEFWLQRHIRGDSFVILAVFIASWVTRDRLGLVTFAVIWLPLAIVAFLCGIATNYAGEKLHWSATALAAMGGMSGGLIAALAVAIRSCLSKRSEVIYEGNASLK